MKNLDKLAKKDAFAWARAEMFFGEGAGIRRKLLNAQIEDRMAKIPGYVERFNDFYAQQNMADHAIAAAKERKHIDMIVKAKRNGKGLLRGNKNQMVGLVLAGWVSWEIAKELGYDEPIKRNVKETAAKVKKAFKDQSRHLKAVD
jgi:hypothetical protein